MYFKGKAQKSLQISAMVIVAFELEKIILCTKKGVWRVIEEKTGGRMKMFLTIH
jgi:hypothetical protein